MIEALLSLIGGGAGGIVTGVVALLAALAGLWGWGKKRERDGRLRERGRQADAQARAAAQLKERLDDVEQNLPGGADAARERLRRRAPD